MPTGYKIVRYVLDREGKYLGEEDFITGWLQGNEAIGRPVDILIKENGVIYISDDKAGIIYRVIYEGKKETKTQEKTQETPCPLIAPSCPLENCLKAGKELEKKYHELQLHSKL